MLPLTLVRKRTNTQRSTQQKINDRTSINLVCSSQDRHPALFINIQEILLSSRLVQQFTYEHKSWQSFAGPLSANSHNAEDRTRAINYKFWTRSYDISCIVRQRSPLDPWEKRIVKKKLEIMIPHLKLRDPKIWISPSKYVRSVKKTIIVRTGHLLCF